MANETKYVTIESVVAEYLSRPQLSFEHYNNLVAYAMAFYNVSVLKERTENVIIEDIDHEVVNNKTVGNGE